jgi:hypothetical protein
MTTRIGLYIMVFLTAISSCEINHRTVKMREQLDALEKKVENAPIKLQEEVIGDQTNTFYQINGQKAYVTINGRPVRSYFYNLQEGKEQ